MKEKPLKIKFLYTDTFKMLNESLEKNSDKEGGEIYVFFVGIDSYLWEEELHYCKSEAGELMDIFIEKYRVKKKNTYVLFDEHATKINILQHLDKFDNILNKNDSLVIYFAGHAFRSEYANLMIPYDGNSENFSSCIPDDLFVRSIKKYVSNTVLFLMDLQIPTEQLSYFHLDETIEKIRQKTTLKKTIGRPADENKHTDLCKFIWKEHPNRVKENFCFIKDEVMTEKSSSKKQFFRSKLLDYIADYHDHIQSLLLNDDTAAALNELDKVVRTNDPDLSSRVETLQFKYQELTHTDSKQLSNRDMPAEKEEITQMTGEVLHKVNQNGFYLVKTPQELREKQPKNRIKILFTSANPRDENFLRLKEEARAIEFELMKAKYRDDFELIKQPSISIDDLQDALLNLAPQFIHFCGHGSCEGIALLNDLEEAQIVPNKPLAELFKLFSNDIKCIFLNSCHSIQQSKEISKYIKKVVCMNNAVPDPLAIRFAATFYKGIGAGRDIRFSFDLAKNNIDLNGICGSDIPVLLPAN